MSYIRTVPNTYESSFPNAMLLTGSFLTDESKICRIWLSAQFNVSVDQ